MHGAHIDPGRVWTHDKEIAVADIALASAAHRHPEASIQITELRDLLHCQTPPRGAPVVLHRDFYPDQVLLDEEPVWLIDLDLAARGDRHVDLGNMLAHLTEFGLRGFDDAEALAPQKRAFIGGYLGSGAKFCRAELSRLQFVSLLRHLMICDRIKGRRHVFQPLLKHLQEYGARLKFPSSEAAHTL